MKKKKKQRKEQILFILKDTDRYLSIQEIADRLNLSKSHIYNFCREVFNENENVVRARQKNNKNRMSWFFKYQEENEKKTNE